MNAWTTMLIFSLASGYRRLHHSECVDTGEMVDCPEEPDTGIEDTAIEDTAEIDVNICEFACAYSAVMSGTDPSALPEEWDNSNCSFLQECQDDPNTETDWHNCVNNIDLADEEQAIMGLMQCNSQHQAPSWLP